MSAEMECRICMDEGLKPGDAWISPCACAGTLKWVHQDCINEWVTHGAVDRDQRTRCNICRHEYRSRRRLKPIMEWKFPLERTLLLMLMLGMSIRSSGALKLLAAVTCIALLEWLNIDDWVRSVQTGLYRVFFHHAALNINWRRVRVLAHIDRYNEDYHYVLKMVCVVLLGFMLSLRLHPSTMLAACVLWEEARDLVEDASVYEWIIDNAAADEGDGAPAA